MDPRTQTCDQDLIIIANAGAGKTRLLVEHYFELLAQGFEAHQIAAFTFTEKAASELRGRILGGLSQHSAFMDLPPDLIAELKLKIRRASIGTIHQFCLRLIETACGPSRQHRIIDEAIEAQMIETQLGLQLRKRLQASDPATLLLLETYGISRLRELLHHTLRQISSIQGVQQPIADLEAASVKESSLLAAFDEIAQSLQNAVAQEKQRQNYLSFDDMEKQALSLIETSSSEIKKPLLALQHLLIDEFQDTSPIQIKIMQALQKFHKKQGRAFRLFLVGDPKQSIYRFRQVDRNLITKTEEEILQAGGLRFESVENYRSAPIILDLANDFSASAFPYASPSQAMLSGSPSNRAALIPISTESEKPNSAELRKVEAKQVAEAIRASLQQGLAAENIAVLYRASASSLCLAEALQERGIPFTVKGGQNLFEKQEILDLKRLLYFLDKPEDDISLIGILRSPLFLLSDATLFFLTRLRPKTSLYHYLRESNLEEILADHEVELEKLKLCLQSLADLIREAQGLSAYAILQKALLRLNFASILSLAYQNSDSLLHIAQWSDWLRQLEEENQVITLRQSVAILKTLQDNELHKTPLADNLAMQNGVQLMTMHAAKGLQFDTVFLIDLYRLPKRKQDLQIAWGQERALKWVDENQEKDNPRYQKIKEQHQFEENEEEKRLLYVALTRAQNRLFVMYDPKHKSRESLQSLLQSHLGENFEKYIAPTSENEKTSILVTNQKSSTSSQLIHEARPIKFRQPVIDMEEWLCFARCPLQHHWTYNCQFASPGDLSQKRKGITQQALAFLKKYPDHPLKPWLKARMIESGLASDEWVFDAFEETILNYFESSSYQKLQGLEGYEEQKPFLFKTQQGQIRGMWDAVFLSSTKTWGLLYLADHQDFFLSRDNLLQLKTQALAALRFFEQKQIEVKLHFLNGNEAQTREFSLSELEEHEAQIDILLKAMNRANLENVQRSETCEECHFRREIPLCPIPQGLPWKRS